MPKTKTPETVTEPTVAEGRSDLYLLTAFVKTDAAADQLIALVKSAGVDIKKTENLGNRNLVYPIKKQTQLILVSIFFQAIAPTIVRLNQQLRHEELVYRYLLTTWHDDINREPRTSRHRHNRSLAKDNV